MQSVLFSALEQENKTLIDRIIKLEAKIQQNDASYIQSQAAAALLSHDVKVKDHSEIQALRESLRQLKVEITRITAEKTSLQTKCANIEKTFQLSETAKNSLTLENAELKSVITQYKTNEELLIRAVADYTATILSQPGTQIADAHLEEGRLIAILPPCNGSTFNESRLDGLNKALYTLFAVTKATRTGAKLIQDEQESQINQALYAEAERFKAEIITLRAQLETEQTERKRLLQDAKESFTQLKNLQAAQLDIRNKKIRELEEHITLLEGALKRKQKEVDQLLSHIDGSNEEHVDISAIQSRRQEEIRTDQRQSFSCYAEEEIRALASNVNREAGLDVGNPAKGLRRVSFDERFHTSSPAVHEDHSITSAANNPHSHLGSTSPTFNSIPPAHRRAMDARGPDSRHERDDSIMRMVSGRRLSVEDAANTIRSLAQKI